jgi:hypothetical protein
MDKQRETIKIFWDDLLKRYPEVDWGHPETAGNFLWSTKFREDPIFLAKLSCFLELAKRISGLVPGMEIKNTKVSPFTWVLSVLSDEALFAGFESGEFPSI